MFKQISVLVLVVGSLVGCASAPTQPMPDVAYKQWAAERYGVENCHLTGRLSLEAAARGRTLLDVKVSQARKQYIVDFDRAESEYQTLKKSSQRFPDNWCLDATVVITQFTQEAEAKERKADRSAASPTVIVQPATKTCNTVLGWTHCM